MVVYRKDSPKVETDIAATTATPGENGSANGHLPLPPAPSAVVGEAGVAPAPPFKPGVARAVLTCRPNSHPFPERVLSLDQPAKVGRSVARCRQAPNNAIFDCKVLSRNHALLWYEAGKFYLQDTKSSNGTFVNNQRLSKGSEESPAQEVCSGDIVQFGVDVVENSRKVTHGCIVATLRLFLPDGKEAKASPSTALVPAGAGTAITTQELYQLSQCIQEAMHREQIIQNKMATLTRVLTSTQEATENNWKAMIEEDRLLNRIETLEAQLQACAKESLKKVLQEKLEALRRVQELEYTVTSTEEECARLREVYETTQKEISALAGRNDKHQKEIAQLQTQLKETEELNQAMTEEKTALENQIQELQKAELVLAAKIESLRADNDFAKEQLAAMKARFDQVKKAQYIEDSLEPVLNSENMPNHQDADDTDSKLCFEKSLADESVKESPTQPEKESELSESKELEINLSSNMESLREEEKIHSVLSNELQELLSESREKMNAAQLEITAMKGVYGDSRFRPLQVTQSADILLTNMVYRKLLLSVEPSEETAALAAQLSSARKQVQDQVCQIVRLQGELSQSEHALCELREQFNAQRQQLTDNERHRRLDQEELSSLQKKVRSLTEELRNRANVERSSVPDQAQEALQEECEALRTRLHTAEDEASKQREENSKLLTECQRLRDSCGELGVRSAPSSKPGDHGDDWPDQLDQLQQEAQNTRHQLQESVEELALLKEKYSACALEKAQLQQELRAVDEERQLLLYQSKTTSACSIIPLCILVLAILMGFYPTLSYFTATADTP
ncbi:hypothetical protein HPB48_017065 [Haemaphysalis longicornis]|uniref:Sarcolemmal membrane-associated protein n=1 Tax=Haemaphysalis longicornis TaxID=44386 RepID=A0A9J6H4S6_HAELO|nr:hypothetical protein HPB48_017065 [Haemaphysalis longicornis]